MKKISRTNEKTKQIFKNVTGRDAPFSIVLYWPWFNKDWIGVTIGFIIFTKQPDDVAHLCHELVHVQSFYSEPFLFWVKYLIERKRVGYWQNRYEKKAYAVQYKAQSMLAREAYKKQGLQ